MIQFRTFVIGAAMCLWIGVNSPIVAQDNPSVVMETNMGTITIELLQDDAPISVENFLRYVDEKHYDGVIFHRVIQNFMIQGGRMDADMRPRAVHSPIKNEADNGLTNDQYTVAMARTAEVDSATDQFFINTVDNEFLNHMVRDYGYAVFGRVTEGTDVVDRIVATPVTNSVPNDPVVIESVTTR